MLTRRYWKEVKFGLRPDPLDSRDMELRLAEPGLFGGATPDYASVATGGFVGTRNQSRTNSCVGFAWRAGLQVAAFWAGSPYPELSPLAIYLGARATHTPDLDGDGKADLKDDGTYLRAAAKAIMRMGAPSEATHSFSVLRVNKPLHFRALREGMHRRGLRGYYRIKSGDEQAIRVALANRLPVIGGWEMQENWENARGATRLTRQEGGFVGRHAQLIESVHPSGDFTIWNTSWGLRFGDDGRVDVARHIALSARDLWAIDVRK